MDLEGGEGRGVRVVVGSVRCGVAERLDLVSQSSKLLVKALSRFAPQETRYRHAILLKSHPSVTFFKLFKFLTQLGIYVFQRGYFLISLNIV